MAAGSENNIVKIMLILSDRKQVFDVPSDIDAQELLKKAKDSFQSSNLEFEEGKNHGKLSLKNKDRLQVKISSNESKDPDGDSDDFDDDSDKNYPVCGAAFGLKSDPQASGGTPKGSLAAYMPKNTLWKGKNRKKKEKLFVFFFDYEESILKEWCYNKYPMSPGIVMSIIREHWNNRFARVENGDEVPRFEYVNNAVDADVRVEFRSEGGSWSALGSEAEGVTVDKPTMVLSFHDKKDDHQIRATIVHEFGHVLGLGHEHQHPSYWKVIKDFVNTESMRKSLKLNRNDFNMQWVNTTLRSSNTPYDEDSVMHYPTRLEWLKEEKYRSRDSITKLHDDKELTDEQYEMLSGFLRHVNFIAAEPSKLDVETVVNAYTEENNKHAGSTSKTPTKAATNKPTKKYPFKAKGPTLALLTFTNGFKLMERAASKWDIIAANLRLDNIENIRSDRFSTETEKTSQVFTEWLNNAPKLNGGKYPKTWKGLEDLLNHSDLAQVWEDFFNALDK